MCHYFKQKNNYSRYFLLYFVVDRGFMVTFYFHCGRVVTMLFDYF